jgi:hypothetical protein
MFSLIINNNWYVYVLRSKTQAYSVSYKASLNIRVIALQITFTFKGSLDLDDMNNDDNAHKKTEDTTNSKEKMCAVNASCWVTTFEDECCLQRGNVSLVRYVEVRDEALAFKLQSEVRACEQTCVRVCVCVSVCV